MVIYTVVVQSIDYNGHHQNSIENFGDFDKAKKFIDDCIDGQKTLEGEDSFYATDISGSWGEYGWIFRGQIPYGIETERVKEGKPWDVYKTKRFIIPTNVQ